MKNLSFFIIIISSLFINSTFSYAQEILPMDEQGKITFTEVVNVDTLRKTIVYENIEKWLAENNFNIQMNSFDSLPAKLIATNEFYVYAKGYISKKIHGKVSYMLTIDIKDSKYRYNFNNFIFHYYKESRNYNMVPSGQTKPLEEAKAHSWQSLWNAHKNITKTIIEDHIKNLKTAAVEIPSTIKEPTAKAKKASTIDW